MKKVIRKGSFETNSSSMHTVVISKDNDVFTREEIVESFYVWNDGKIHLYEFEMTYGRSPFKCLFSFGDKWKYCLAAMNDKREELENILFKYFDSLEGVLYPTNRCSKPIKSEECPNGFTEEEMEDFMEEHGYDGDFWTYEGNDNWFYDRPFYGYAEDYGMLKSFLEKNKITIEEFLINKKYVILVDGDEYCIFDSLKESGLINKDFIEREFK